MFTPSNASVPKSSPVPASGISVIIPTFNGLSYTRDCITSLRRFTPDHLYDLHVVDNGSSDGTIEWLQAQPDIHVHLLSGNPGFVAANNHVLEQLPPERDALLLNNDTRLLHEGWLENLQRVAYSAADIGIVGCRLVSEEGLTLHTGTYMPTHTWQGWQIASGQTDTGQFKGAVEVEGVIGACMYIRHDVLARLGGLHKGYISYFEDTDYCFQCLEAGYRILCDLDTRVLHHEHVTTKTNKLALHEMLETSRSLFLNRWQDKVLRSYRLPLLWQSVTGSSGGYAGASREFIRNLDEKGVEVRLGSLLGSFLSETETGDPRIDQARHRKMDLDLPQVVFGQGDLFYKNGGAYKIGYSMLETTGIPAEWVLQCNRMDEVWVPSDFNRRTFTESGVTRPIHVIPLGIDPALYHPGRTGKRFSNRYTFLSVFEWGERKNPAALLRSFCKAFDPQDDVALVIKYSLATDMDLYGFVSELQLPAQTPPIVFMQSKTIADHEMGSFYRAADCFVLPTYGEGWGMPMLEAMACGLPTVATEWSALTTFMHEGNSYPVPVKSLIPAKALCPYYSGFEWAEVDEGALAERLRHIYSHPEEAREKGLRASLEAHEKWTWSHATDKIIHRLQQIGM